MGRADRRVLVGAFKKKPFPLSREVLNSILNPNLPLGEAVYDPEGQVEEVEGVEEDSQEILSAEKEAVQAAEKGYLKSGLKLFDKLVELNPGRPSSYNNRAQALRIVGRPDSALKDLDTAIKLSKGKGKAGCNALCQRGVLLRKEGRDDDAMENFKTAAENGSGFAKAMLVEMNPYAAMCNAMLKNVFTALQEGGDTDAIMENNLKNKTG